MRGPDGRLIERLITKDRLLQTRHGEPRAANAALQLAAKTWVADVEIMIRAFGQAIERHHPGQTVIDMAATAEEARRVWARSRPSGMPGDLGHDYFADAEQRFDRYHQRALREDWTVEYAERHRAVLREHGVYPADDTNAREFNRRITLLVDAGLPAEKIKAAALMMFDELIFEREPEEDPDIEEAAAGLADDAADRADEK